MSVSVATNTSSQLIIWEGRGLAVGWVGWCAHAMGEVN